MSYTTDWKPTVAEAPAFVCRVCLSHDVWYRDWESSDGAHDDVHYQCRGCKREWWYESSDY